MKSRINGQGHHPKVRVYVPRVKFSVRIRKIILSVSSTRWLTIIRRGDDLDAIICNHLESELWNVNEKSLLEPIVEEMGCPDSGTWYVDTDGCGMLQVNEANPPPKHGFLHKAMHYAASVLIIALMALLNACHKDPTPQPQPDNPNDTIVTPTDTLQPIIPTKEITLYWDWDAVIGWAPPKDSIKYYTDQDSVKTVDINIIGRKGPGFPVTSDTYRAVAFHNARDTLQTRIDLDPNKVKLSGTLLINETLPDTAMGQNKGIFLSDSTWFANKGCFLRRPPREKTY